MSLQSVNWRTLSEVAEWSLVHIITGEGEPPLGSDRWNGEFKPICVCNLCCVMNKRNVT